MTKAIHQKRESGTLKKGCVCFSSHLWLLSGTTCARGWLFLTLLFSSSHESQATEENAFFCRNAPQSHHHLLQCQKAFHKGICTVVNREGPGSFLKTGIRPTSRLRPGPQTLLPKTASSWRCYDQTRFKQQNER